MRRELDSNVFKKDEVCDDCFKTQAELSTLIQDTIKESKLDEMIAKEAQYMAKEDDKTKEENV